MTDHDFTEAEQAAIEQAATDHLSNHFVQSDAEEIAYDIANSIRAALVADVEAERAELNAKLATIRKHQIAAVVGAYFSWKLDETKRNDRPVTHSIADGSREKFRGALMVLQDLLEDLGEIEGDEELEAAFEVVKAEIDAAKVSR